MTDLILNIETATCVCSVSVSCGNTIISLRESFVDRSHAALLTVFIEEAMREAGKKFHELSAIAVSKGPGSYTGLRIGVSTAKGVCFALDLPLIAVDTLTTMSWKVINMLHTGPHETEGTPVLLCPMIDARRMEVYTALYDSGGNQKTEVHAEIIDELSFKEVPESNKILFFGDGAEKCKKLLQQRNTKYIPGIYPSAEQMAELSYKAFREGRFEDIACFEPFYLKDFIAKTPKNKMF